MHIDTHATWGGGQYQVLALASGLVRRGVPMLLVARAGGALNERARASGVPVLDLPPGLAARWRPGGGRWLARWVSGERVALYHAHDSRALTLALGAARRHRAPVVLSRRVDSPWRRNFVSRFRHSPRRLRAVVATSRTVADVVSRGGFPRERTFVVESATDVAALDRKLPIDPLRSWAAGLPLVGSAGKLVPKKNWDLLVRTAAAVRTRGHDVRWIVAGDGPEYGRLAALASEMGVEDHVRFERGPVDPERVVKSLDVMFHPARREGSGAIVRVGLLAGVPVVVSRAAALVDAVGEHGLVVDPDDADGAAEAVIRLLDDPRERGRLAAAARAQARPRYDIDRLVEATLAVYGTVTLWSAN